MNKPTNNRQIFITDFDSERLIDLIDNVRHRSSRDNRYLEELGQELMKAEVVIPSAIPPDVITMNSRVCLQDMDSGEELIYTLVFPADANLESGKISVLAPIGTALIGYRTGDRITWRVPAGVKTLEVKNILYQPEASGDYHL